MHSSSDESSFFDSHVITYVNDGPECKNHKKMEWEPPAGSSRVLLNRATAAIGTSLIKRMTAVALSLLLNADQDRIGDCCKKAVNFTTTLEVDWV